MTSERGYGTGQGEGSGTGQGGKGGVMFPSPPSSLPAGLTQASERYRRGVWLAVLVLFTFISLYLGLTVFFARTAWLALSGLRSSAEPLLDFLGGAFSAVITVFLVKGLLGVKKSPGARSNELSRADQPDLFAFLDELADRTSAPRAHRVYLSHQVNAGVFYDVSLKNVLIPSKKNLEIGLPLINVLSLSELTAVLAHEFGHFAQSSMAVGQWVYTAQQVAAHLISTRDWLDNALLRLSRSDIRIAWIGWALRLIIWSVRAVLDLAFRGVVLADRALSREMEFQADLVAVSMTGSEALIHALARLRAADEAWDQALSIAADGASEGKRVPDLFVVQTRVIEMTRSVMSDPTYGNPRRPDEAERSRHRVFERDIAAPPRMWSTHPANRDREENAKRRFVPSLFDERSSWCLFRDAPGLRRRVTAELLSKISSQVPIVALSDEEASALVDAEFSSVALHPRYKGFYLGRSAVRDVPSSEHLWSTQGEAPQTRPAALVEPDPYPDALVATLKELRARTKERNALEAIHLGHAEAPGGVLQVAGQVVPRRALPQLVEELDQAIHRLRQKIAEADRGHRQTHLALAERAGGGWPGYLRGLMRLAHYAGHQAANVSDALAHYRNVLQIVTADGNVSKREAKRLTKAAGELHGALSLVFMGRPEIELPEAVSRLFGGKSWQELLPGSLGLPAPTVEGLGEWVRHADDWAGLTLGLTTALERNTLDVLLEAEHYLRDAVSRGGAIEAAPSVCRAPLRYEAFTPEKKRPLQRRLDLWDRFILADGFVPAAARLLVAVGILFGVIGMTNEMGKAQVHVVNGLAEPVRVSIGGADEVLQPGEHRKVSFRIQPRVVMSADGMQSQRHEQLVIDAERGGGKYVYNVQGGAALVRWDATYGSARPGPTVYYGHKEWLDVSADYYFEEPPSQIKIKGSGEVRHALSVLGSDEEQELLRARAAGEPIVDLSQAPETTLVGH